MSRRRTPLPLGFRATDPAKVAELDGKMIALLDEARSLMEADRLAPLGESALTARIFGRAPLPWSAALEAAARIPAQTPEGLRRKAEAVADWLGGGNRLNAPFDCTRETAVAWSLLLDLLGEEAMAPMPPPRTRPSAEEIAAFERSQPPMVELPEVPDRPWLWHNAARAIRDLPVQGWRLSTALIAAAKMAEGEGNHVRAHNLLLAAGACVMVQADALDVPVCVDTDVGGAA